MHVLFWGRGGDVTMLLYEGHLRVCAECSAGEFRPLAQRYLLSLTLPIESHHLASLLTSRK